VRVCSGQRRYRGEPDPNPNPRRVSGWMGCSNSPAWCLDQVRIRCEKDKRKWSFACGAWLTGDTERTLTVSDEDDCHRLHQYHITVVTSDKVSLFVCGLCPPNLSPNPNPGDLPPESNARPRASQAEGLVD